MGGSQSHWLARVLIEAVERVFWTVLIAGLVTAILTYLILLALVSLPSESGDGEWALVALVVYPLLAVTGGVFCGVITSIWHLRRRSTWPAAAVAIAVSMLLAVLALVLDSPILAELSVLCWLLSAAVVLPAVSAITVSTWMARRSPRQVRYSRVAGLILCLPVSAAVAWLLFLILGL